jgi:hypothetical protein
MFVLLHCWCCHASSLSPSTLYPPERREYANDMSGRHAGINRSLGFKLGSLRYQLPFTLTAPTLRSMSQTHCLYSKSLACSNATHRPHIPSHRPHQPSHHPSHRPHIPSHRPHQPYHHPSHRPHQPSHQRPADCLLNPLYRAHPHVHVLLLSLRACSAQIAFFKDSLGSTLDLFLTVATLTHSIAHYTQLLRALARIHPPSTSHCRHAHSLDRSLYTASSCARSDPPSIHFSLTTCSLTRSPRSIARYTQLFCALAWVRRRSVSLALHSFVRSINAWVHRRTLSRSRCTRSLARSLNTASSGTRLALSSLTKWRLS